MPILVLGRRKRPQLKRDRPKTYKFWQSPHCLNLTSPFMSWPQNFLTLSKHPLHTLHTPSRHCLHTLEGLLIPLPWFKVIFTNFKLGGVGCAGYVVGCAGYVVGGLRRLCGGLHPNNRATSWPNLQAGAMQDFKKSWNPKLDPCGNIHCIGFL